MHSSSLASRIASADTSPVATPKHLIAFAEAILDEVRSMLDPIRQASENTASAKLKAFSSIAQLRRATGLSRERIVRLIHNNPGKIRAIAPNEFSPYKRYNSRDFLQIISKVSSPTNPLVKQ